MAAECLCFRARRVSRVLTRVYDEELRPLGIQATQLTLLNAIALSGEAGARMNWLAELQAMDGTTLSRNLRPLERAGLIVIGRLAADRRVRVVELMPEGQRLIQEAHPHWQRAHERIVSFLGPEAAAELRESFDAAVAVERRETS
jgi:DNA-binding MarR family transcriptional regulator